VTITNAIVICAAVLAAFPLLHWAVSGKHEHYKLSLGVRVLALAAALLVFGSAGWMLGWIS
jgi:hypothetical protein